MRSRGLYDEAALLQGLESGRVAGALDVLPRNHRRQAIKAINSCNTNGWCTPHLGASTEAGTEVAREIAEQVDRVCRGQAGQQRQLTYTCISAAQLKVLRPYLDLGERMGAFLGQLDGKLNGIEIRVCGELTEQPIEPVTTAVLSGLLQSFAVAPDQLG
ncbi:MAG: hypothetical protein R3C68_09500 [Myxococcota bacterium]